MRRKSSNPFLPPDHPLNTRDRREIEDFEEGIAPVRQRSNPIQDFLTGLALKAALNQLKGLPHMQNILLGAGTYTMGITMIVVGAASVIGSIVPLGPIAGFSPLGPQEGVRSVMEGFAIVFLRRAIANSRA